MRVCDFIFDYLNKCGIKRVYGVVAGGSSGLCDGVACNKDIEFIPLHGEGSCGYASVGESKYTQKLSCVLVGTGCCNTNLTTSILTAWQDSIPVIFIAGDVNASQLLEDTQARNWGVQGNNPVEIFKSITKLAITIKDKNQIPYFVQKAVFEALDGRRGPVFLNIPTDIQTAEIEPEKCEQFRKTLKTFDYKTQITEVYKLLTDCKRPVLLVGNGARDSSIFLKEVSEYFSIPIVSTYGAQDFIKTDNYIGTVGTKAGRASNFVLHQSDLVIVLGSSLNVSVTGYNFKLFAPNAKVVVVDIDETQHQKSGIKIDLFYKLTVGEFLSNIYPPHSNSYQYCWSNWLDKAIELEEKWPICLPEYSDDTKGINPYFFLKKLYLHLKPDSCLIGDAGGSFYSLCQSFYPKGNQRFCTDFNNAAMFYMIPAAIGTCLARDKKEVIGICGDGSFAGMINELSTIAFNNLPIKIFVINNNGYNSLKKTQENFYKGRYLGINKNHNLALPNVQKIAECFDINYFPIRKNDDLGLIRLSLSLDKPVICEVFCPEDMSILPTIGSKMVDGKIQSMPLWNMSPFLSEEEINKELEEIKNL